MSYSIKTVRSKIMEALEPLRSSDGVKTIAPYSGQFDGVEDANRMRSALVFPAVLVSFLRGRPGYFDETTDMPNMRFAVIFAAKNLSGQLATEDATADLLDSARPLLNNQYLGLNLSEPVSALEEYLVRVTGSVSIYAMELSVNFERPV